VRSSCKMKLQRMGVLKFSNLASSKSATSDIHMAGANKGAAHVAGADKRTAQMAGSTGSLQGSYNPRHNEMSYKNMEMDTPSMRTCMTPIDV